MWVLVSLVGGNQMFSCGQGVFVQFSVSKGPGVLHPATIVSNDEDAVEVVMEEGDLRVTLDQNIVVLHEIDRVFMKQAARVIKVGTEGQKPSFRFLTLGEPVSAERRQLYRVSTVMSDLTVGFGREKECPLLDVNAVGFSAKAHAGRARGETVNVSLPFKKKVFTGTAFIQSVRELGCGFLRYGLTYVNERGVKNELQRGLLQVTMTIQRKQLKRQAGAG